MKLISLYIKEYKNIKEQTFDFSKNNGLIALIGDNGSGKSNILEAVSLIFAGVFQEEQERQPKFAYQIVYSIGNNTIHIAFDGSNYTTIEVNGKQLKVFELRKNQFCHPTNVIACYSGEDLRLWHSAFKSYQFNFFSKAIINKYYPARLLYINKDCWEIALIALLCAAEEDEEVLTFIKSDLKIDNITDVAVSFVVDEEKREQYDKHDASYWFNRICSDGLSDINARTIATTDITTPSAELNSQSTAKRVFQYLYILSQPKRNDINKVDKLVEKIVIDIKGISFEGLSEGEKKLILIECIAKVLTDDESLILFDEPDVFLHPKWQRSFLSTLKSTSCKAQTIITTHNPILLGDSQREDIHLVASGAQSDKQLFSFGRDINSILEDYFNIEERNQEGKNLIKDFYSAMDAKDYDKADILLGKLRQTFGNEDIEYVKADNMFDDLAE